MKRILHFFAVLFCLLAPHVLHARVTLSEWQVRLISNISQQDNLVEWMPAKDTAISSKYVGYMEYTTELTVSDAAEAEDLGIYLGDVSDTDKFFVNDVMVGATGSFPPEFQAYTDFPREYLVPAGLLFINQPNKIKVLVYVEYPSKKGIKLSAVKIGSHAELQHAKYYYDVSWYFSKLITPLICMALTVLIFLSLKLTQNKRHALVFIGIALSFCIFGLSRSRITFHLFEMTVAYKILVLSGIAGVSLLFYHSTEGVDFKRPLLRLATFLPLVFFAVRVIPPQSVNEIFSRYEPWFNVGTLILVVSFALSCWHRKYLGNLFTVGMGILTILGVYDTIISISKIRAPYLFDVGINMLIITLLYKHIIEIKNSYVAISNEKVKLKAQADVSAQVAHDIRSPLAALTAAAQDISQLPEDKRIMIRSAVQRIGDIANDLAGRGRQKQVEEGIHQQNELTVQLLSGIIDSLISEKRLQFRARLGVNIQSNLNVDSYGLFGKVEPVQFKRVLSNLVNNAVEAIANHGTVTIGMKQDKDYKVAISVSDSGTGIPPEILSKLMQHGATFNKKDGQGLGLFHARESVQSWGGEIRIESRTETPPAPSIKEGVQSVSGTTVTITLPFEREPAWFVAELVVYPGTHIVILDDDDSIHQIWKGRFETKESGVVLHHFSNGNALREWHDNFPIIGPMLILCDYEILGSEETGLDVIKTLGLAEHTILVTSRFEEKKVRESCESMAIRLLPKNLAGFVPIRQVAIPQDVEFVLIDDNRMNRTTWEIMARAKKRKIITFERPKDFFDVAERINKDAKFYVDLNLGAGISGKDVTRDISCKGFENIFLYTGEDYVDTQDMPWIKGVVGKSLPFGREKN